MDMNSNAERLSCVLTRFCLVCQTESSVVKCGGCAHFGVETWFCPDCLDEGAGECGRCEERDAEASNAQEKQVVDTCSSAQQLDHKARAVFGREILSHAFQATDSMTT